MMLPIASTPLNFTSHEIFTALFSPRAPIAFCAPVEKGTKLWHFLISMDAQHPGWRDADSARDNISKEIFEFFVRNVPEIEPGLARF